MIMPAGFKYSVDWPPSLSLAEELLIERWLETHVGDYGTHWMHMADRVWFVSVDHAIEFTLAWS